MAYRARPLTRPPLHPGAVALGVIEDAKLSVRAAATALGMKHTNLDKILKGERPITPETAVRFGVFFGNGANIWLRMQGHYDLYHAERALAAELKAIKPLAQD